MEMLDLLGMGSAAAQEAILLSGGESQRVAVARSTVCMVEIWLQSELGPAIIAAIISIVRKVRRVHNEHDSSWF